MADSARLQHPERPRALGIVARGDDRHRGHRRRLRRDARAGARVPRRRWSSSGLPQNAIVQQAGSDSEMTSALTIDAVRVIEDAPQVARRGAEPLVSGEVVVIAALPLRDDGQRRERADARRLAARAGGARQRPDHARPLHHARAVRDRRRQERASWRTRVSTSAGPSASVRARGRSSGSSTRAAARSTRRSGPTRRAQRQLPASAGRLPVGRPRGCGRPTTLPRSRRRVEGDPQRAACRPSREPEYYASQSRMVTTLITVLGGLVAVVMGARRDARRAQHDVLGRRRTLARDRRAARARLRLGRSIVLSFLVESTLDRARRRRRRLPRRAARQRHHDGHDQLADLLAPVVRVPDHARTCSGSASLFALVMGVVGGLPPAIRAARANVASALRAL